MVIIVDLKVGYKTKILGELLAIFDTERGYEQAALQRVRHRIYIMKWGEISVPIEQKSLSIEDCDELCYLLDKMRTKLRRTLIVGSMHTLAK